MKNTPYLYNTLTEIFGQHKSWLDKRHFFTLVWMVTGLIESGLISLTAWAPYVDSRAVYAQSTARRFRRWLANKRINVHSLYGPIIADALCEWNERKLYLALDTSMLWDQYCLIHISVIYRGRAIPLVWTVIEHGSSSVAFETYRSLLDQALTLIPSGCQVVFLADRGFAENPAELIESLAQIFQPFAGAFFRPEEGGELFAAVRFLPLAHQVDEQPHRFVHAEGKGATIQDDLQLTKGLDLQSEVGRHSMNKVSVSKRGSSWG